ncbi:MAG: bifunctional (p)ppGpp synthetase/guanosine-3',5'-bis(diphosphate) 3'-pyrophosphohydrolase [Candidatus Diapherotrites archaeon]|nr:bifunctional (p)ppGpp synthetase/guanosine-3',5'-bis(diphosphate) 3'-pyrophosphohydrolase [Candidatus Diapherotrites archaeon]
MAKGSIAELLETLQGYETDEHIAGVQKAFELARGLYGSELRESRKFCIKHLVEVAGIVAGLRLDCNAVSAALLHEAVADGKITAEEIEKATNRETAALVDGLAKLKRISLKIKNIAEMENMRKVLLATSKDIRTLIILLAERVAELGEFGRLGKEKQEELAEENLNIYAPIAHKMGMNKIKDILEDNSLKYLKPEIYSKLAGMLSAYRKEKEKSLEKARQALRKKFEELGINAEIQGRTKHIYSIYRKIYERNIKFNEIYDLVALRVITGSVKECYELLGMIHSIWNPLPGRFDDYIARPKPNMYQSLHTTVIGPDNRPIEIQIRTLEMHRIAEDGIAAHWRYKGEMGEKDYDKKLLWLKEIYDWQRGKEEKGNIDSLKIDFFENNIFVLTPKGEVIELPEGSTPIDFAYAIHSDLGGKCERAKVDGKLVPLSYALESGDNVEIITSPAQMPKSAWLNFVKTSKAREKIREALQIQAAKPQKARKRGARQVIIKASDKRLRLAKCCSPLPGDEVVGILTTKRKISVHRANCENIRVLGSREKIVNVDFSGGKGKFPASFAVEAKDRPNLLSDILNLISRDNVTISSAEAKSLGKEQTACKFVVMVSRPEQLERIINNLSSAKGITRAYRI